MKTLLIEIGAEEIPAGYIEPALDHFRALLLKRLDDGRIAHGEARVYGTPRRLAVMVESVAEQQEAVTEEVTGPPESVGFDADGRPTMAAKKFAEKIGVAAEDLRIIETPKGRYLAADKTEAAGKTTDLLAGAMPEIIASISFPKTMKWGTLSVAFARPVQWLVALFGDATVSFSYGDVASGAESRGHRFLHPDPVPLSRPEEYLEKLRAAHVEADLDVRRKRVAEEVAAAAKTAGGTLLPDEELIDTVKNLVETPEVVVGRFDRAFLEVPDEVLITAMREHQKYFAATDGNGKLLPAFVVVNNTRAKDMDVVARGHERVLRARLSDAQFFFRADLETPMENWVEKLRKVLFQAKLGSVYEKVLRIQSLAEYLAEAVDPAGDLAEKAGRAARLCKADLVSQVVVEFPKLQGVMGRIYAERAGEDKAVAVAIEEHYRPTRSGGALPTGPIGAATAAADKIDSICGCFSVGLIPTGAADPYALRRQGIGLLQIFRKFDFGFSLRDLVAKSVALFADRADRPEAETVEAVYDFLKSRLAGVLAEEGFSRDVVAAVLDVSVDPVPAAWERARALEQLKARDDFEPLAVAFKRVVNIIRKSGQEASGAVDEAKFEHPSEGKLFAAFTEVGVAVSQRLDAGNYEGALEKIATLKGPVDAFFDDVMVMAEDPAIRANRLALLGRIADLFATFADFTRIAT
ncbi:MAG: glycine--tRNA ligase subunit beta [Thermodesulfobacteriota bacterium]